jgi:hypothetical protein
MSHKIKLDITAYPCYNVGVGYFLSQGGIMEGIVQAPVEAVEASSIEEAPQGIVLEAEMNTTNELQGIVEGLDRIDEEIDRVTRHTFGCLECGFLGCRC